MSIPNAPPVNLQPPPLPPRNFNEQPPQLLRQPGATSSIPSMINQIQPSPSRLLINQIANVRKNNESDNEDDEDEVYDEDESDDNQQPTKKKSNLGRNIFIFVVVVVIIVVIILIIVFGSTDSSTPPVQPLDTPTQPTQPPVQPPTQPPVTPPVQPPVQPSVQPPVTPPVQPPVQPPAQPPVQPPPDLAIDNYNEVCGDVPLALFKNVPDEEACARALWTRYGCAKGYSDGYSKWLVESNKTLAEAAADINNYHSLALQGAKTSSGTEYSDICNITPVSIKDACGKEVSDKFSTVEESKKLGCAQTIWKNHCSEHADAYPANKDNTWMKWVDSSGLTIQQAMNDVSNYQKLAFESTTDEDKKKYIKACYGI